MSTIDFYQNHLNRVSRSFAFCIQKLESPLREWVSLSYLLCRTLDTVEDSPWENVEIRASQYSEFDSFIRKGGKKNQISQWASRFPDAIPEGETTLLLDASVLFKELHGLPAEVRASIEEVVLRMSAGMRHYSSAGNTLRLSNLFEVNRYCYFVAGIVGELLTKLVLHYRALEQKEEAFYSDDLIKNAFHFGLFLQKVNLLKDQIEDEKQGRFLVPDRELMLASLRENARGSIAYLTSIPKEEKGYRVFCAWSLFLGAASLPWIAQAFEQKDGSKIPRAITQELLEVVEEMSQQDETLREELELQLSHLPEFKVPARQGDGVDWFIPLAGGVLSESQLTELLLA
jgi:phytoene/squalene synthetase